MSIFGRRRSREHDWNWSHPPEGPRRSPSPPPLLPLAGAALLFAATATGLLALWLSESNSASSPTATPTATAEPTLTPTPTSVPSPTPTPEPGPDISLAVWDGQAWQPEAGVAPGTFREGEAVPLMLRIESLDPGDGYPVTIRYTCTTVDFLPAFDRDAAGAPALAAGAPGRPVPDATVRIPDDPATRADDGAQGAASLWGGLFGLSEYLRPPERCRDEKAWSTKVFSADTTLYLLWGAQLSRTAANGPDAIRLTVNVGVQSLTLEIDRGAVTDAP